MKLINICDEINWKLGKLIFIPQSEKYHILTEYLNSIYPNYIDNEIKLIDNFLKAIKEKNKIDIEKLILEELEGFIFIHKNPFVKIAGAHDLAPSVLYDYINKNITIFHPNTKQKLPINLSVNDILSILKDAKAISNILKI